MHFKGVIFDMDGVLVDTESLKANAHSDTTAFFGNRVDKLSYINLLGKSFDEVAKNFIKHAKVDCSIDNYRKIFNKKYEFKLQRDVRLNEGAEELLTSLFDNSIFLALVTSSQKWMVNLILSKLGILKFFENIVSSEDVSEEKPSPEPYNKALMKIRLNANECLAFEDSESGIISASAAGLTVYGIRHRYNVKQDFSLAKGEFRSFTEIDIYNLI